MGNGDDDARVASGWAPAAVVAPKHLWMSISESKLAKMTILLCAGPSGDLSEVLAFAGRGARCGDQEGVREGRAAVRRRLTWAEPWFRSQYTGGFRQQRPICACPTPCLRIPSRPYLRSSADSHLCQHRAACH